MTNHSKTEGFARKSRIAALSARLLLTEGYTDGALSRSYFAMLHAAQALHSGNKGTEVDAENLSEPLRYFGRELSEAGKLSSEWIPLISKLEELHGLADERVAPISPVDAAFAVRNAENFVKTLLN